MLQRQPLINHKLRAKRLIAGLTESQLAEAVARLICTQTGHGAALDGNYISKLERGRITWPNSVYRAALREFFDAASDAELGFYSARTRSDAERWLSTPGGPLPVPGALSALPATRQQHGWPGNAIVLPSVNASQPSSESAEVFAELADGQ
jgi:hypothetical protein